MSHAPSDSPEPHALHTDSPVASAPDVELALCRSALYEAFALGFAPPSVETIERIATPLATQGLVFAAEALDRAALERGSAELAPLVHRLAETDTAIGVLTDAYGCLFGHTARGPAPAYETEYGGGDDLFRQPQEMADLGGFYAAFGLVVAPQHAERPDHVRCECEFMMFLARKEALALEQGDAAMLGETRKAARLFLRDHLGRFMPSLCARITGADVGFYAALARLADAFVCRECARLDVSVGPPSLRLRTPVEDRVPMACGTCPLGPEGADDDAD